jgi:structural maintenance of chromosome 2
MQVTFHDKVRAKSVTLDGDVTDPSGTLTGGSRPSTAPVLAQLHELRRAKDELAELEGKLATIDAELKKMSASASEYRKLK